MLVDRRYGEAYRRSFKGRNLVACQFGEVSQRVLLQFNLVRVEIRELRPEVVTEDEGVLVHYLSRTNVTKVIF